MATLRNHIPHMIQAVSRSARLASPCIFSAQLWRVALSGDVYQIGSKKTANLYDAKGNNLFHWNPRASGKGGVVVRNSKLGGKWGKEERGGGWPFGSNAAVSVRAGFTAYEVSIGGKRAKAFDYKYRSTAKVTKWDGVSKFVAGCWDQTFSGYVDSKTKYSLSCPKMKGYCKNAQTKKIVQKNCPKTCGVCGT